MKRTGLIVTIILALVAFVCGFGGVTTGLYLTQPTSSTHTQVLFVVHSGDTATDIANNLQSRGLIRNALAFKLLAKVKKVADIGKGTYTLYTDMTMEQILKTLLAGATAVQVQIAIPPGWRVAQYPSVFTKSLSNFNADNFMKIVTTGKYLDGTTVNSKYWFVPSIQPNVKFALEGYLFPDTYNFYADDDEAAVINRLLNAFGEQLCPGPDAAHADAYLGDKAQCKAHPAKIGDTSIFTLLEKKYSTSDDTTALYRAVTIASLVMREVSQSKPDIQAVTNVYYNRWLVSLQGGTDPAGDMVANLGGDPTAQYARDTDTPPKDGVYWKALTDAAIKTDPNNLYNTNNPAHKGLMPGPISAPVWTHIADAINPNPSGATPYYFFWASCQSNVNKIHYAANYADFQAGLNQFPATTC